VIEVRPLLASIFVLAVAGPALAEDLNPVVIDKPRPRRRAATIFISSRENSYTTTLSRFAARVMPV
jgi:hypothetical protein